MQFVKNCILILIAISIFSCQKENPAPTLPTTLEHPQLEQAEADASAALAELESDYLSPPKDEVETIGDRATVYLPAGSQDGLTDAINQAGPGGKVVVKAGDHYESGTVMITQNVKLIGETGAKLYVSVAGANEALSPAGNRIIAPALYIKDCNFTRVENLHISPQGLDGVSGIFIENSQFTRIKNNTFKDFRYSIWASNGSNYTSIYDNDVVFSENLSIPQGTWGITVEEGRYCNLKGNYVENYGTGIFASDEYGKAAKNDMTKCGVGFLACTVQGTIELPNGAVLENAIPCHEWKVINNNAYNNFWNYLIIDGANNNFFFRNDAADAGLYDVELAGVSSRFGVLSPTSSNNFVVNVSNNIITKDCGENNTVLAGDMVDVSADPCF